MVVVNAVRGSTLSDLVLASPTVDKETTLRFSLDSSLGRLARYLRLLGHDAAWNRGDTLEAASARARDESRVLLTRSNDLAKLSLTWPPAGGQRIVSEGTVDQLVEVARRWPIFRLATPFSRCSGCNELLETIDSEKARPRVPPYVAATHSEFHSCPRCEKLFWGGTHTEEVFTLFQGAAARIAQPLPASFEIPRPPRKGPRPTGADAPALGDSP